MKLIQKSTFRMRALSTIVLITTAVAPHVSFAADTITTYAGGGPNNLPALQANLQNPVNTAVDKAGNYYVVSDAQQRVFKINSSGTLTIVAGNGFQGYSGDGGPATQAQLYNPYGVTVDSSGNVYIGDYNNCVVRKVTASTGIITTFAGKPQSCGYSGDGEQALTAQLNGPEGVALDASGNLYISDSDNQRIRKVSTTGIITTLAGNGTAGYSGEGTAVNSELYYPVGVATDRSGNVYIADQHNQRVRKVTTSGIISTIGGNGTAGYSGDGGPGAKAELNYPLEVSVDSAGRVFIADTNNFVVREIDTSGNIHTVAGDNRYGFSGDGGTATSAELGYVYGVAVNSSDNFFIADHDNQRVRKAILGGDISTVVGSGNLTYAGNDTPASGAVLDYPLGVTPDRARNVYVADQYNCVVRKISSTGIITTFAGTPGVCNYSGDGSAATSEELSYPSKAVSDSSGNVYIADRNNCVVRKVTASTGRIATFAGTPQQCGFGGDTGPATAAFLSYPTGLALDNYGNVYVADTGNQRIRKVNTAGYISTPVGVGSPGYSGDGGLAVNAQMNTPNDVAVSASGALYIADSGNNRIRVVQGTTITTFAGNGGNYFQGDGEPAQFAVLNDPTGVAVDVAGDVLIADRNNQRVRWVNGAGLIYTVAGDGTYGLSGDGGPATNADLAYPSGVGVDLAGNIYVGDQYNNRVREVAAIANLNASTYNLNFEQQQVGTTSDPQKVTYVAVGPLRINSISTSGDFTEADDCPTTLSSGQTCMIDVTFSPSAVGARTGFLTLGTSGFFTNYVTVALSGFGGGVSYAPGVVNFGTQKVGTLSNAQNVIFTNHTKANLTFTSVTTTRSVYIVSANTCSGVIAAGKSCTISLKFDPTAKGLQAGSLVVKDSDLTSPQLIPLRGTGD